MTSTKKAIEAIRLREDGERLYIFAIANKKDVLPILRSRKCRYLTTSEFEFYENDYVLSKDSLFYQINKWFVRKHLIFCGVYKFYKQLQVAILAWWHSNPFPQYSWPSEIKYQPVLADRIWKVNSNEPSRISVNGQISIQSDWTEDYYLNPSQKYLKARVDNWIKANLRLQSDDYNANIAASLQYWRRSCLQDGYEITYLASLDT